MFGLRFRDLSLSVAATATLVLGAVTPPMASHAATIGFHDDARGDPAAGLRGTLGCPEAGCSFEALRSETANFDVTIGGLFNSGTAPTPLPAGAFLLITALGGLGVAARRRRKSCLTLPAQGFTSLHQPLARGCARISPCAP